MIKTNLPTIITLNNCDELKHFIINHFENPLIGIVNFQGDNVEFGGYAIPKDGEVIFVDNHKSFKVGKIIIDTFVLTLSDVPDEGYGVELPSYVREELIATLKGEW